MTLLDPRSTIKITEGVNLFVLMMQSKPINCKTTQN